MRVILATLLAWLITTLAFDASAQGSEQPSPRLTRAPELLSFSEEPYPESELANPREVEVILLLLIDESGHVTEAQVTGSVSPAFDEAAVRAARSFVFSPAEIDSKPAAVKLTYRYHFSPPVPELGSIEASIVEQGTDRPLSGVRVVLDRARVDHTRELVTAPDGVIAFDKLEPGEHQLEILVPGLAPMTVTEQVQAGQVTEAVYAITLTEPSPPTEKEGDDLEVEVVAPPELTRRVVSAKVQADEAGQLPGTQGDALKVVQSLPGIARASAASGDVVVWGAAPRDTRTYVGAVRIPALYHFGGLRSVVHGDLIDNVELVPGGYGVSHGRGLGGLILIDLKEPNKKNWGGSLQADLLDASTSWNGPVAEKTEISMAARKSYVAALGNALSDDASSAYFTIPDYYDGAARVRHELGANETIEGGVMISGDSQTRTQPSNNPALRASDKRSLSFQRVDIRYEKNMATGERLVIAPWYGHDFNLRQTDSSNVSQQQQAHTHLGGLRIDYLSRLGKSLDLRSGLDVELAVSADERSGSLTSPPRIGDPYVFGQVPSGDLAVDTWNSFNLSVAPFAEFDFKFLEDRLHLVPGVRFEPYVQSVNRSRPASPGNPDLSTLTTDVIVEPRFNVAFEATKKVSLQAGAGLYRQPAASSDLSAVFGNPLLNVERGAQSLAGASFSPTEGWQLEATGFYTKSWDLTARSQADPLLVAQTLVQDGEGRTYGGQVLVRKLKLEGRFHGWITYTLSRSERRSGGDEAWTAFDQDQTHLLTALGSYELGLGFEVGARVRYATGSPRTPVEGSFYNAAKSRYEPLVGELNSTRLPDFFQLDVRVSKHFDLPTSELEIYLDVQNVTNQENAEEIAYSPDYSEKRYVVGMPILPVLGARLEF